MYPKSAIEVPKESDESDDDWVEHNFLSQAGEAWKIPALSINWSRVQRPELVRMDALPFGLSTSDLIKPGARRGMDRLYLVCDPLHEPWSCWGNYGDVNPLHAWVGFHPAGRMLHELAVCCMSWLYAA